NDRTAVGRTLSSMDVLRDAFYPLTLPLTVAPAQSPLPSPWVQTNRTSSGRTAFDSCSRDWLRLRGGNNISLLWVLRPPGGRPGSDRNDVIVKLTSFLLFSIWREPVASLSAAHRLGVWRPVLSV